MVGKTKRDQTAVRKYGPHVAPLYMTPFPLPLQPAVRNGVLDYMQLTGSRNAQDAVNELLVAGIAAFNGSESSGFLLAERRKAFQQIQRYVAQEMSRAIISIKHSLEMNVIGDHLVTHPTSESTSEDPTEYAHMLQVNGDQNR